MNGNMKGRMGLAAALLALATACSSGGGVARGDARGEAFPDASDAWPRNGVYVNVDNLRQTAPGMSKRQLYALLGTPHYNEGLWGVREWNYLFNFRRGAGSQEHFSCQLQVDFDDAERARAYHWKPAACKGLTEPLPVAAAAPVPAAAPLPAAPPHQTLRLSADAMFAFDSAELTARGRLDLMALVNQIQGVSSVQDIVVSGYTDRLGSDAYNLDLSHRRALAVRGFLIGQGVPPAAITAEGHGKAGALVDCRDASMPRLIECLAPNRRVEISGLAMR